jgi:hypothetical protein
MALSGKTAAATVTDKGSAARIAVALAIGMFTSA